MTLNELLECIDFKCVVKEGKVDLVDMQDAYLGGRELYTDIHLTKDICEVIVDKLSIYFRDAVYKDIVDMEFDGKCGLSYSDLFLLILEKEDRKVSIKDVARLYYLIHPEDLVF